MRAGPLGAPTIVAIVALSLTALFLSVSASTRTMDVDEAVFARALRSMQDGQGYYPSMRDAIAQKEGRAPSEVRAFRMPTLFVGLRFVPADAWRGLAALPIAISLALAAALGARLGFHPLGAVASTAVWLLPAVPHLALHAELWGLPAFLAGLLLLERERGGKAAWWFAAAAIIREFFLFALIVGALRSRERRRWIAPAIVVVALGSVHVLMARAVLSPAGGQVALGNEPRTLNNIVSLLAPGDGSAAGIAGIVLLGVGLVGVARALRTSPGAKVLLPFAVVMIVGTVVATRDYWLLTVAPALMPYAGVAFRRPSA